MRGPDLLGSAGILPADQPLAFQPRRIARSRSRGARLPDNTVYVGRPTLWGNPFTIDRFGHARCVILHKSWLEGRLGVERGKHWAIGSYVIAEVRTVTGGNGRYQEHWTRSLYPKAQSGINQHPRHPTGFDLKTGLPNACVSPSCSFYADLCKYGEFKWAA